jgi:uncharacterized protein YbjT (DUF2867 family)
MSKKTIAVVGATGAQGGGLVRAILADPSGGYAVRAVTRDPASDKAKALAQQGAEVVAANVDDKAAMRRAFDGAHGAFCVTFFWDHFSPEKEQAEARAMAEAAKEAGVKHVIWSTLEDTRQRVPLSDDRLPTLMGKYKVPHFDAKGEADAFFRELTPATCLRTSFYWDNLIYFGMGPKPGPDGTLAFTMPMADKKLPGIAAEDIGRCAYGVFKRADLIAPWLYSGSLLNLGMLAGALIGEENSRIGLWSVAEGREYRYLAPSRSATFHWGAAIHRGGRLLAMGRPDGVSLFDLETGRELDSVSLPGDHPFARFDGTDHLLTNGNNGFFRWPVRPDVSSRMSEMPSMRLSRTSSAIFSIITDLFTW